MSDLVRLLVGGKRIVAALGKNTSGRYGMRFSRGVSTHVLGQAAVKGVRRIIQKAYQSMSEEEKWVTDQATELAVRIAASVSQGALKAYIDQNDLDRQADIAASSLSDRIVQAINSRAWSVGYDFVFGKIDREGKLIVQRDLIKQAILAGTGEYLHSYTESHRHE
ncbi:MAG: hypothetical protein ING16_16920 [Roseomonas sp.]|jgi:hypothetical protein|nr:hypothetical protein [Roseomonas sp.]MCA3297338.1 hypothetical protein [Roseomonas sp.]